MSQKMEHPVEYLSVESALGWLLVAGSSRGIQLLSLGDSQVVLETPFQEPRAGFQPAAKASPVRQWAEVVLRHLDGQARELALPLDAEGTPFQQAVWQALRALPYGSRCTYSQLAERIGRAGAVRAVARACASNRVALVIPCHRVVRSDGGLGGYRWGVERKRRLLERELATCGGSVPIPAGSGGQLPLL